MYNVRMFNVMIYKVAVYKIYNRTAYTQLWQHIK